MNTQINICLNNIREKIYISENENMSLYKLKKKIIKVFSLDCNPDDFFLKEKDTGILINNRNFNIDNKDGLNLELLFRIKGGIIDAIVKMLKGLITMFIAFFKRLISIE